MTGRDAMTTTRAGPGDERGNALLAERAGDAQAVRVHLRDRRGRRAVERKERRRASVLFDGDRERREPRSGRAGGDVERAGLADDAIGRGDREDGRCAASGEDPGGGGGDDDQEGQRGHSAEHGS